MYTYSLADIVSKARDKGIGDMGRAILLAQDEVTLVEDTGQKLVAIVLSELVLDDQQSNSMSDILDGAAESKYTRDLDLSGPFVPAPPPRPRELNLSSETVREINLGG